LSKLIKSDQCIEAHPCRLEPIDVDAFFINDEFSENKTAEPEAAKDSDFEAGKEEAVESTKSREDSDRESIDEEKVDLNRLSDLAGRLGSLIGGVNDPAGAGNQEKDSEASKQAEQVLNEARQQAEFIMEAARHKVSENNSLLESVQSQYREFTEGAKEQAGSILDGAKKQAGDITHGAGRQAEQIINEARQQADFTVEAANRKASQILEKAQLQTEETIQKARQEAAELIEAAKKQAEQMVGTAGAEGLEIKKQAQQEGFQTGHQEGLTGARKEFEGKLATAISLLAGAEEERLTRIRSSEPELVKLAGYIAEKIIGAELKLNPNAQLEMVKEALAGIPTAGTITIKINPDDFRFIEENLSEIKKVFSDPIPVEILQAQGIAAGNCYIETDHGNVDPRIKTQLEVIMTELGKVGRLE
jgi:flagellar assembly protein FliH